MILDCVRYKSLGASPLTPKANAPNLEELARRGIEFTHAVSPSNWTIPSHFSILTGLYPNQHGMRSRIPPSKSPRTFPEVLNSSGYETALFSEQRFLTSGLGMEVGFRTVVAPPERGIHDSWRDQGSLRGHLHQLIYHSSRTRKLFDAVPGLLDPAYLIARAGGIHEKRRIETGEIPARFAGWLDAREKSGPFFAMVNITDAHEPFVDAGSNPPMPYVSDLRCWMPTYFLLSSKRQQQGFPWRELEMAYLKAIADADRKLGLLLQAVDRTGYRDSTWVVVTSDHGQQFGEAGLLYHGIGATDAVARVPLVISSPNGSSSGYTIHRWSSLTEIPRLIATISRESDQGQAVHSIVNSRDPGIEAGAFVYTEGAPPSDYNPSVARERAGSIWNRRTFAAFGEEGKYLLDPSARNLEFWPRELDPDDEPAVRVSDREYSGSVARVYGDLFTQRGKDATEGNFEMKVEASRREVNSRLLAWGYS